MNNTEIKRLREYAKEITDGNYEGEGLDKWKARTQVLARGVLDLAESVLTLEEVLLEADELFRWLQEHYPKALREYPTVKYQRLRRAALTAEEQARE